MSNGDLASLGAVLRAAREERALTLEEVETDTRIRVKFLEALENGDLSVLPSVAHARGFLRNYAQYLRLDANAMATQFSILTGTGRLTAAQAAPPAYAQPETYQPPTVSSFDTGDQPASPPSMPTPYPPPAPTPATGTGPLRARSTYVPPAQRVGPGMPAGVPPQPVPRTGATPAYGLAVPAMQPQVVQPERPSTPLHRLLKSNLFVGGILLVAMIAIVWWAVSSLSSISSSQFATTPDSPTFVAGSNGSAEPASIAPFGTGSPSPQFGGGGPNSLDRVLLNITVTQRTWARIVVDGTVAFEGQLVPGSVVQYQGVTSVIVRAGNAAGLSVNYNGQDLGPLGGEGEVVERTFTTSGQITPTPTLTPTPTNTPVPSPTPRFSPTPNP